MLTRMGMKPSNGFHGQVSDSIPLYYSLICYYCNWALEPSKYNSNSLWPRFHALFGSAIHMAQTIMEYTFYDKVCGCNSDTCLEYLLSSKNYYNADTQPIASSSPDLANPSEHYQLLATRSKPGKWRWGTVRVLTRVWKFKKCFTSW